MNSPSSDKKQPYQKPSPPLAGGDKGEGGKFMFTLTQTLSRQGRGKKF